MFVLIKQSSYFVLSRGDRRYSMLAYICHRIIHIYMEENAIFPKILLSPSFLMVSSFMIVHRNVMAKIQCYIYWSTWWCNLIFSPINISGNYVSMFVPIQQFIYVGSFISYSIHSMLPYIYHRMVNYIY